MKQLKNDKEILPKTYYYIAWKVVCCEWRRKYQFDRFKNIDKRIRSEEEAND
jgi:hypothetical protein